MTAGREQPGERAQADVEGPRNDEARKAEGGRPD